MHKLMHQLNNIKDRAESYALLQILEGIYERMRCQTVQSAALRIKGGSASPTVQTNAIWYGVVRGVIVKITSATDWTALSGTVTNAKFNVFVLMVDQSGTKSVKMGTEAATLGAVKWPVIDFKQAIVGFVIINPTGTGNFVGGTSDLDDATIVPNAVFVNTTGAFDPTADTGL